MAHPKASDPLVTVVLLAPGGALVAWATASRWVLALALAVLAGAGAVLGAAISAALDE